jgi:hypothetical protein
MDRFQSSGAQVGTSYSTDSDTVTYLESMDHIHFPKSEY